MKLAYLLVCIALLGTGGIASAEEEEEDPVPLALLKDADQLKEIFNEAEGKPRLILFLSPT